MTAMTAMNNMYKIALAVAASLGAASPAAAVDPTHYVGEVIRIASNTCPADAVEAKGQLVPLTSNIALFSLVGTRFGGDGSTTFGLPLLKPVFANDGVRVIQCIVTMGNYPTPPT
jgi:microcystin-dependent protein